MAKERGALAADAACQGFNAFSFSHRRRMRRFRGAMRSAGVLMTSRCEARGRLRRRFSMSTLRYSLQLLASEAGR